VETDWGMIAVRLGLYLSLMLLVGLAAFPLYALRRPERDEGTVLPLRKTLICWSITAIILSILGFLMLVAGMSGIPIAEIDWQMSRSILLETQIGTAWLVRMAALTAALAVLVFCDGSNQQRLVAVALAAATALSSLVWTGHAGASEGDLGTIHQVSDILHMLAAAIWLGGIGAFLLLLKPPPEGQSDSRLAIGHRALDEFSRVGTVCVSIILLTGLLNGQILVGLQNVPQLLDTAYGQLLVAKILIVGAMMLLAAKNRWRLTPGLALALSEGNPSIAVTALRKSLLLEATAAFAILALVAWLGTLEPTASMAMP
jgi:putative copper resistance protein D